MELNHNLVTELGPDKVASISTHLSPMHQQVRCVWLIHGTSVTVTRLLLKLKLLHLQQRRLLNIGSLDMGKIEVTPTLFKVLAFFLKLDSPD